MKPYIVKIMNENLKEKFSKKIQSTLGGLGNNKIQDILEEMGMLDENGCCPYTAEETFRAGVEWTFGEIFGWTLDDADVKEEYEFSGIVKSRGAKGTLKKLIDEIEYPKFNVGDWVVNKLGDVWHIDSFDMKNYQVSDGKGNYNYFPISKQDEMHLWTIEDAKGCFRFK